MHPRAVGGADEWWTSDGSRARDRAMIFESREIALRYAIQTMAVGITRLLFRAFGAFTEERGKRRQLKRKRIHFSVSTFRSFPQVLPTLKYSIPPRARVLLRSIFRARGNSSPSSPSLPPQAGSTIYNTGLSFTRCRDVHCTSYVMNSQRRASFTNSYGKSGGDSVIARAERA